MFRIPAQQVTYGKLGSDEEPEYLGYDSEFALSAFGEVYQGVEYLMRLL